MAQAPRPPQPYTLADSSPLAPPQDPIASLRAALRAHYEFERELGQGAFATVYLARDLKHDRKVAIKVLNADPNSEIGELRFIREIRMLARLQHPNILPLHDSGHVEALLYYVMPFVKGETLRARIQRERQLGIEDAACVAQEAADAVSYAHAQGIIHRDIKPENILLSEQHAIVADFGIARAIDIAGIRQLTRTGFGSPGTPAYMAPEQLLGEGDIDARCDIYSLGCVLYEMVTGKPPFAGKDGFVKRFTEPPPKPSSIRPTVPKWMDDVTSTALARDPADRYPNAAELTRALTVGLARERATPAATSAVRLGAGSLTSENATVGAEPKAANIPMWSPDGAGRVRQRATAVEAWWKRHSVLAAAIVAILTLVAIVVARHAGNSIGFGNSSLDSTRFVVVPLAATDRKEAAVSSHATDKLYDAFRSWDGLNIVPDLKVNEALGNSDRIPTTLGEAMRIARKLGAGQLVWGHIVPSGDALIPRAELYDLRQPNNTVREVVLASDSPDAYARAAAALLAPSSRPLAAVGGDGLTHNYAAWAAYNRAHIALAAWKLPQADSELAQAVAEDPDFAAARLWLGQVREWRSPSTPQVWREHAERAAMNVSKLDTRDSLLALSLLAMANDQYPTACAHYRELTRRNPNDFVPWYGLGECQALDAKVLADATSPSGVRWRTSYHAALQSYARALALEPGAHALLSYQRLRRLLPISAASLRVDNADNPSFAAYPSLSSDTLAFVPYPVSAVSQGLPASALTTRNQALTRNVQVLYSLVTDWTRVYPQNADAYESLADVLETRGDISDKPGEPSPAMTAIRIAVKYSKDPQQRLRLAVRGARLRFKRGDFVGASRAADSLFAGGDVLDRNDTPVAISLAAMTGRLEPFVQQAERVVIPASVNGIALSPALSHTAAQFFAMAALGVCGDTLAILQRALESTAQSSVPEQDRAQILGTLTARPLSFIVPCTRGASALKIAVGPNKLFSLQQEYARRSRAGVVARFREIGERRRLLRPGDVSLDYTYQEAWVAAQIGDTVSAIGQLDKSLNALPLLSPAGMREPAAAAAAGRAMILRAELAAKTRDVKTARRWASALADLWANADVLLQPAVRRMRHLAATGDLQ